MFAHPKISAGKRSEREGGNTGTDSTESSAATVAWFGINFCGIVGTLRRKARKINPNEITQLITATGYMFYMQKKSSYYYVEKRMGRDRTHHIDNKVEGIARWDGENDDDTRRPIFER